jgi:multidrug efflux pump subunit AcrA (membrane-fusion protein)
MKKCMWVVFFLLILSASGCDAGDATPVTPEAELPFTPMVSVTGEVVPAVWATLSAQAGGTVEQVLVEPGDEVAEGEALVIFEDTDAQLAVQRADAALRATLAELALLEAGPRAEEIAVAEAQIEAARAALAQAAAQRDQLKAGGPEAEIAAARAQLAAAEAEQRVAWEQHDKTMKCYQVTQPDGTKSKVCPTLGTLEEQARLALQAADQAVAAAQARLQASTEGAGDQVAAAESAAWAAAAQRDVAQAQLALLEAGATEEQVAIVQAAVAQAQVELDAAQVALERCTLRAPFAGTVGDVRARVGELITPGVPVVTVGDLGTLRVETTDLDEIDVAQVREGQKVTVTFDALPDQVYVGWVTRIDPMADPDAGGVNYTVVVALEEVDPAVRWGMTAFVDVEVE